MSLKRSLGGVCMGGRLCQSFSVCRAGCHRADFCLELDLFFKNRNLPTNSWAFHPWAAHVEWTAHWKNVWTDGSLGPFERIYTHMQTYRRADVQTYRPTDVQTYRRIDAQTHRCKYLCTYIHRCICIYIHIHTRGRAGRQADRQADRQTDKRTEICICIWICMCMCMCMCICICICICICMCMCICVCVCLCIYISKFI